MPGSDPLSSDPQGRDRWFPAARVLRPQGRRGELLAEPLTDLPEVFNKGTLFRIATTPERASTTSPVVLEDCWRPQGRNAGRLVLKLAGIDSITAAEALQELQLFIPEAALPSLEEGTYLVRDLLGCSLYDGDTLLGTIVDLQFPVGPDGRTRLSEAADLFAVEPPSASPEADTILVPFVNAWLTEVNIEQKRIQMQLPPGLRD